MAILPLRCFLLQNRDPKKWNCLYKMAKDADAVLTTGGLKEFSIFLEEGILKPLRKVAPKIIPESSSEAVRKISVLLSAHGVSLKLPHTGTLSAVTAVSSFMQHNCMPNTRVYFEYPDRDDSKASNSDWRGRVIVRAAKDIPKGDQLTTVLADVMINTYVRQNDLINTRNVICRCARCSDPTELGTHFNSLKCQICSGWVVPTNMVEIDTCSWQCTSCNRTLTGEYVEKFTSQIFTEFDSYTCQDDITTFFKASNLEALLTKLQKSLHLNHSFVIPLKMRLVKQYGSQLGLPGTGLSSLTDAELERKAELCRDVQKVIFKFHVVTLTDSQCAVDSLLELVYTNTEILRRKLRSKAWKLDQTKKVVVENRKLMLRAFRIQSAQYIGPEVLPKPGEDEEIEKSVLAKMKQSGFSVPDELLQ